MSFKIIIYTSAIIFFLSSSMQVVNADVTPLDGYTSKDSYTVKIYVDGKLYKDTAFFTILSCHNTNWKKFDSNLDTCNLQPWQSEFPHKGSINPTKCKGGICHPNVAVSKEYHKISVQLDENSYVIKEPIDMDYYKNYKIDIRDGTAIASSVSLGGILSFSYIFSVVLTLILEIPLLYLAIPEFKSHRSKMFLPITLINVFTTAIVWGSYDLFLSTSFFITEPMAVLIEYWFLNRLNREDDLKINEKKLFLAIFFANTFSFSFPIVVASFISNF